MTRKDYEAFARELRKVPSPDCWATWKGCVDAVAKVLAADNPRFDVEMFHYACGIAKLSTGEERYN